MSIKLDAIQAIVQPLIDAKREYPQTQFRPEAEAAIALIAYARDLEARIGRVEALAEKWERTPALRRGTSAAAIRAALTATEGA